MRKKLIFFCFCLLIVHSKAQSIYFPPILGNTWDTISPATLGYCTSRIDSLFSFLEAENTKAFILLKDGKIVLEKYFGSHTQNTPWQWASAGKTITSFMVGIAQQEGYLSISDTTSKYLGAGWSNCLNTQEEKITIKHHLTMTSGLDDGVTDPYCTDRECLIYKADAGTRWAYHNAPYTLLDKVIENATGATLNAYTTQKLKTPTGMTGTFVTVDFNNVFFSTARSMARFGLLTLNKGNWDGNQLLKDSTYFKEMINTSQYINPSYGYLWWLNGKSSYMIPSTQFVFQGNLCQNAPKDLIVAMGKGGQFLNVIPSKNMVWLRMGDEPSSTLVPFLLNDDIWKYVNKLTCTSTGIKKPDQHSNIQLYPNPCHNIVNLKYDNLVKRIEIQNSSGQILMQINHPLNNSNISTLSISKGTYIVKTFLQNSKTITTKLIKR